MHIKIFFFFIIVSSLNSLNAKDATELYIERYSPIAINEMNRVGIPASIKMAQAILESNSGRSTLARQSNNHFGIKCGKSWKGREVYREDDDYENGLLIRSCFRAYDDPAESFYAHSKFLANPYSKRYKFLFDLDIYDYKAWAKGLKKAGYATDPNYPSKLIGLIEKYSLYELDLGIVPIEDHEVLVIGPDKQDKKPVQVIASAEVDVESNSKEREPRTKNTKHSKYGWYMVKSGDVMADIASAHGIELRKLYFQNRMPFGAQPKAGEQLALNHFIHFKKTPKWIKGNPKTDNEVEFLWEESITITTGD